MKPNAAVLLLGAAHAVLSAAVLPRDGPNYKVETLSPQNFKELGAQRVRITYGPYVIPSSEDPATHGMVSFRDFNVLMPCRECFITGLVPDLRFEDGKTTANANKQMWLHHIGLMNLNRTDSACTNWPERIGVNGNERSDFDFTLNGTRKAGYYLRSNDHIFLASDIMNMAPNPQTVTLTIEWEYVPRNPSLTSSFDVIFPVWLDVKGNCLNETLPFKDTDLIFTAKSAHGWTSQYDGEVTLIVPHIHDGNTAQRILYDGKVVCTSIPAYGESAEFVSHETGGHGGGHDHGTGEHVMHVSSISQCKEAVKVKKGGAFVIESEYDMVKYTPMKDHDGGLEPIMGIAFLHLARGQVEAVRDIEAMKGGDLNAFVSQVRGG